MIHYRSSRSCQINIAVISPPKRELLSLNRPQILAALDSHTNIEAMEKMLAIIENATNSMMSPEPS